MPFLPRPIARIAAPLPYLLVAAVALYLSIAAPFHNWDALAYIAAAESFEQSDSAELQRFAYAELRKAIPESLYQEYAQEAGPGDIVRTRFRHAMRTQSAAFEELLSFYRVRPVYNALVFVAYKSGIDIELATHLISGIAVAIALLALYAAASACLPPPFVPVLPLLALAWGVLDLARWSTPDGLAFLASTTIVMLFLRRRFAMLLVLLPLALGVRSDLVLFTAPLLAWLFVTRAVARWKTALSALASMLVYVAIVKAAGNAGWSTFFYCSAIERCIHPLSDPPVLRAGMYWQVLASGSRALLADPRFDAYAILLAAFGVVAAVGVRRGWPGRQRDAAIAVAAVCCAYVVGRFLVLPDQWWRFFTAPYVLTSLALLCLLGAAFERRGRTPATGSAGSDGVDPQQQPEG